ncbi:hypothetical protein [Erythrobacter sp.]|uniref:hypothetical protein n=1 Tax=Erythrobacter sp. TaxID=1042 RepID=UPI003C759A58
MAWIDLLRMRLAQFGSREPDRSPKRYAPHTVWSAVRTATVFAYASIPIGVGLVWLTQSAWPLLLTFIGAILIWPTDRQALNALVPELLGSLLGSRYCPACGQSIFDRAPASGYMADHARGTWWPHRHCANCGHDLKVRTIE